MIFDEKEKVFRHVTLT